MQKLERETEMSSHWQFWAGGIYKGSPHKSKEPSFMSKQWTLVRKWDQIFFVLFFSPFWHYPSITLLVPLFSVIFCYWGEAIIHQVCVSPHLRKKAVRLVVVRSTAENVCLCWSGLFFLHPLLLLSTHADKFTDRVSFLCLGTGSIAVCSGPLFYPLSPLENESLCQKAAWNMMQSLRPQQSLRLYHHMRWRLKRFFIHHKTYSICWTWVDVMTGGKIYSL